MRPVTLRAGLVPALLVAAAMAAGCDVKMAADGDFSVDLLHGQAKELPLQAVGLVEPVHRLGPHP